MDGAGRVPGRGLESPARHLTVTVPGTSAEPTWGSFSRCVGSYRLTSLVCHSAEINRGPEWGWEPGATFSPDTGALRGLKTPSG